MEPLVNTAWLSKRLGLSIKTIERKRSKKSSDIPPHLLVGSCIRYDTQQVEQWLAQRLAPQSLKENGHE